MRLDASWWSEFMRCIYINIPAILYHDDDDCAGFMTVYTEGISI